MSKLWTRLSTRERRLAVVVGVIVVAFCLYVAALPAIGYLGDLDTRIDDLEQEVLNLAVQAAQSYSVEVLYARLSSQHSTVLTEAEIQDGLQRELDRLSYRDPDVPDPAKKLLSITYRPEGQLTVYKGYREYQTTFATQPSPIQAIAEFLRRLQESPQSLRIDALELRRENPSSRYIIANVTMSRIVVDRVEGQDVEVEIPHAVGNMLDNPGFEEWDDVQGRFPGWESMNCVLSQVQEGATEGVAQLRAECQGPQGAVFQPRELVAGRRYRLSLHLTAAGPARLEVMNMTTGKPFEGGQALPQDGKTYFLTLAPFTVPGKPGEKVTLALPYIRLEAAGCVVHADNVTLEEVPERP